MWEWGKGGKKPHKNCSSHLRKNLFLNVWRNVHGHTRHLLRSRHVIKHKPLALHFLFLKLMKGCGCSGRHSVQEEHNGCLLPGELFSPGTSSNPHPFSSCCIHAFHFHVLTWSFVVLWLPSDCELVRRKDRTHHHDQPDTFRCAAKGDSRGDWDPAVRSTPNIFISTHIWEM